MWFVFVVAVVFGCVGFECKYPDNPFPFYQLKLGFPSEAFWLQWIQNEALFLGLTVYVSECVRVRVVREHTGRELQMHSWLPDTSCLVAGLSQPPGTLREAQTPLPPTLGACANP